MNFRVIFFFKNKDSLISLKSYFLMKDIDLRNFSWDKCFRMFVFISGFILLIILSSINKFVEECLAISFIFLEED